MLYNNFSEMVKELGEEKVMNLVNHAIKDREYRKAHHKEYNAKRNAQRKALVELAAKRGVTVESLLATLEEVGE